MNESTPEERRSAVVTTALGVGLATGTYGVSFGALSTASGLTVLQTCALSLLVFTGASQFAFVGVVAGGGSPITGSVTALLLGTRNLFYGASLAASLRWRGLRRWSAAHLVIDESTAVALAQGSPAETRRGFVWTGLSVFVLWNAFTLVGAVAGTAIGDPRDYGLDAAVGAAFLALLWPRLTSRISWGIALVGAAVATALVPLSPAGVPIILGGAVAVALGLALTPCQDGADVTSSLGDPLWWGIALTVVGCYALKLAGLSVPERLLDHPTVQRTTSLLPVGLLGALVAVQVLADGTSLRPDARIAGLAVAAVLLALRVPFLAVVVAAAATAALLRL